MKPSFITKDKLTKDEELIFFEFYLHSNLSTPFHNPDFLVLLSSIQNIYKLKFLIITLEEKVLAIMPFFQIKYLPFTMNSSIYGCYGGFLCKDENKAELKRIVDSNNIFRTISLLSLYNFDFEMNGLTKKKTKTWIFKLEKDYDKEFLKIHSKTRNQIRKAQKEGVKVSDIREATELEQVIKIYKQLVEKHDIKRPYQYILFKKLFELQKKSNDIIFKVAKLDETIIAFSIFIKNNKSIFYWINASNIEYQNYNGTNLILNEILKLSIELKLEEINFGAVPLDNKGLHHFKSRWGAIEKIYYSFESKFYSLLRAII